MHLDKLKGTLVDFNELEHVLDNFDAIGTWQLELRKANDDPLELDELILHVEKLNGGDESRLRQELNDTDRLRDRDASQPDQSSNRRKKCAAAGRGPCKSRSSAWSIIAPRPITNGNDQRYIEMETERMP